MKPIFSAQQKRVLTMCVVMYTAAYVCRLNLSAALWQELKGTGIRVLASCPGPTETDFWTVAGNDSVLKNRRTPQQVVDATMDGLRRNRPVVIDGAWNKALAFAARFAPVQAQTAVSHYVTTR